MIVERAEKLERTEAQRAAPALMILPRQWRALLILAAALGVLPFAAQDSYVVLLFNVMALNAVVVLGLNLLVGSTGQVSLGHAAFYGLGAYLSAVAATTWQWPLPCALLFAIACVAATSFLLAIPTLRLEGHYLVMATLGFNIIVFILLNQMEPITGGPSGFPGIPKLHLGPLAIKTDRDFYFFIWSVFILLFALTLNLTDSRIGRAFEAIHEKDLTAQALGIPTYRYKVMAFVLSAVYAAIAGFCYAHYVTFISPKTFDIFYSVQIVTMVAVGGMGSLWGGLLGAALLTYLPEVLHHFEDLHVILYGAILMGVLVFCPKGLLPMLLSIRSLWKGKAPAPEADRPKPKVPAPGDAGERAEDLPSIATSLPIDTALKPSDTPALSLDDVTVGFGGLIALQGVRMDVRPGEIVALIGPNGAGKTTLLNVISGLIKPQKGDVQLLGKTIIDSSPHRIAARGIGRTFQAVQVFERFNVLDNILLGFHVQGSSGLLSTYLHAPGERREEGDLRSKALNLLAAFGLERKANLPIRQLSLIEQKLLELARALALSPKILLMDEPVGGLNPRESETLMGYVSQLRSRGVGIVLVEHDMNVVMRLADRVVVLQHGSLIATGTPREIQQNPKVIEAYLGTRKR